MISSIRCQASIFGILLCAVCLLTAQCKSNGNAALFAQNPFPYHLDQPDEKYKLPDKLEEISGLGYVEKGLLACIQDEKGKIHHFDIDSREVSKAFDFKQKGDYEGIEIVGRDAYVLKSNGTIIRIKNYDRKNPVILTYNSFLSSDNDAEGLAYEKGRRALLVACKEDAGKGSRFKGVKSVYRFDLRQMDFERDPAYLVSKDSLAGFGREGSVDKRSKKQKDIAFKPSGLAVHPATGHIYIISSVGKLLVVLDQNGDILQKHSLDKDIFKQPEGICFSPGGDLYISNEGRGKTPNILLFKPKEQ